MARESERTPFKAERIPCEIWLQIIESSDFTQSDTASLSQVSKFVRLIAMPMLFKTISLTVTLVRQEDATASVPGQSNDYHERLKTRLTFAALPSVAHAVKFVCIRHNGQRLDLDRDTMITPDQLVDTLFQYLHHFPNVRSFSAQKTTLRGQHFDELASLRHLNGMHFYRCSGTGELGLDRFHLKYLSLDGNITGRFGWWIPLLQSSTLYHVSYGAPPGESTEKLFLPALATAPRMTSLQVMRLPALSQTSPCYATALRQCPFVEDLLINGHRTSPAIALPLELLPRLKAVCAPLNFVTMALVGRPLKHITITDCQLAFDSTQSLVQLHVLFPSVEELALPSIWMRQYHPLSLLHGLLAKLPQLRGLYVRMYGSSKNAAEQVSNVMLQM